MLVRFAFICIMPRVSRQAFALLALASVCSARLAPSAGAPSAVSSTKKASSKRDQAAPAKPRILFLISDTGGGHRASANALKEMIEDLRPGNGVDMEIVDIWTQHGAWPHNNMASDYARLARLCGSPLFGFLWRNFYRLLFFASPFFEHGWALETRLRCGGKFRKCIESYDPDLVVSLHPLTQHLPLTVLDRMGKKRGHKRRTVPFATVVTDLGSAHPAWFHHRVDACFVPTEGLERHAVRRGVAAKKIKVHGLPVRRAFWQASAVGRGAGTAGPKADKYAAVGLRHGLKTVLVVGGGDGAGGLAGIVGALASELGSACPGKCQIIALCGKNAQLRQSLLGKAWEGVSVEVRGFTSRISDYMECADTIVTKAGPGTIAEATIRGLPIMLSSHLPGQEAGNVPFVVDGGFGEYSRSPKKLASTVAGWVRDDALRERMRESAQAAAHPDATQRIAEDLLSMLQVNARG